MVFDGIGRSLYLGVLALGAIAGGPALADQDLRQEVRERIKAGKINSCITDALIEHATEPVVVLQNNCDSTVHVTLCAKTTDQPRRYFFIAVRPHADARHRLWIREGEEYRYTYNSCEKPYCMPPKPQC